MGVRNLYKVSHLKYNAPQVEKELRRRVETLSGVLTGTWRIDVEHYEPRPDPNSQMVADKEEMSNEAEGVIRIANKAPQHICLVSVNHSETASPAIGFRAVSYPCQLYLVAFTKYVTSDSTTDNLKPSSDSYGNDQRAGGNVRISELLVASDSMRLILTRGLDHVEKITSSIVGVEFSVMDFVVRVGICFEKGAPLGSVLEIEYLACSAEDQCSSVIYELVRRLVGSSSSPSPTETDGAPHLITNGDIEAERVSFESPEAKARFHFNNASDQRQSEMLNVLLYCKLLKW